MELLGQFLLFFAKVGTVVIGFLILFAGVTMISRKKKPKEGSLEIKNLNNRFQEVKETLQTEVFTKEEIKKYQKEKKEKSKLEKKNSRENKPRLFVLNFQGDIKAKEAASLREEVTALLTLIREKDEVFVHLESPGGIVPGYGLAAGQLKRIRDRKIPLIISIDKVAASGGYMMACQGSKILASPFAVVGSIGVLAQIPNFNKVLKKNNIEFEQITGGEFKRTLTMFGENTEKAREKFQDEVDETHKLFKSFVKDARPQLDLDKVATGEHWYGTQALDLNLIDEVITSDDYLLSKFETHDIYELSYVKESKGLMQKLSAQITSKLESFFVGRVL
ncbi:MAG: protease SohB [Halobacteriovoraceae bacterium]|nr:protease SohB [Halobacteriovoraceae bacterium]